MSTCNSESAAFPFSALLSELWRTREFEQFLFAHIFIICSTAIWLTVDGNQSRQLMRSAVMTSLSLKLLTISLLQRIRMTRFLVCFNDIPDPLAPALMVCSAAARTYFHLSILNGPLV